MFNQDKINISNTDDIHSCVTPKSQNISVKATYTPPCLTALVTTLPILPIEVPKTTHLPPLDKEYLCFQVGGKRVVFGTSIGKIGKVVINGVKQGGVDVAGTLIL